MTNNPITLDGKQYTVSEETTYTIAPGKVYLAGSPECSGYECRLSETGTTQWWNGDEWNNACINYPLRELIPVPESKVREIKAPYCFCNSLSAWSAYQAALNETINEALQASHLRIHNVDGSVSEFKLKQMSSPAWFPENGRHDCGKCRNAMAETIQLAFQRGSTVEVVE